MIKLMSTILSALTLTACGISHSSNIPTAVPVTGPGGYSCFAIMDGDRVAGGSCVKQ